jgi:hypothetical protein
MSKASNTGAFSVPHSWDLEHWPVDVYPHTESRARYLIRAYRDELTLAGALTRVGREIVVFGEGYSRFLEKRKAQVPGYITPPRGRALPSNAE